MVGSIDLSGLTAFMVDQFEFAEAYGFLVDSELPGLVTRRSGDRFLIVAHDWRDGWTSVLLRRGVAPGSEGFSLQQAITALAGTDAWPAHGWSATSEPLARQYVSELAQLLATHSDALLAGDGPGWALAAQRAVKQNHAYTVEVVSRPFLRDAEAAWRERDWKGVIAAYEAAIAAGASLRPSEARRLDYARTRSA